MISSYHVRFLESHDGHARPLPETEEIPSTLNKILERATPTPILLDEEEEEVLPDDLVHLNNTQPAHPTHNPENDNPIRRSSRIAEKSNEPRPTRTEKAVQESTDAGIRLRETRAECKKTLQDIREEETRNAPEVVENAAITELMEIFGTLDLGDGEGDRVDQVLSAISEMPQIDPSTLEFEDEPRSWKEAKESADAKRWEEGYRDELKSLKEMGVYKLIPRSDVPQGHKIRKGMPVFSRASHRNRMIRFIRYCYTGTRTVPLWI